MSARTLVEKGAQPVRLDMPAWSCRQLEGWTPHSSVFLSSRGQGRASDFSFLSLSAMLRLYQGFMPVRQVFYLLLTYVPM